MTHLQTQECCVTIAQSMHMRYPILCMMYNLCTPLTASLVFCIESKSGLRHGEATIPNLWAFMPSCERPNVDERQLHARNDSMR